MLDAHTYGGFLDELEKIAASSARLTVSKTRTGRRPISVENLLKKDKAGELHKKAEEEHKLHGHMEFQGIPIAIENRKGSTREGVDPDGKPWKTTFALPYGYIKKTEGKDGEEIDAYIGPASDAPTAFVVHQRKIDGTGHDEDKVFLGMLSEAATRKAYLKHYNKVGPKLLGDITSISIEDLKKKLEEKRKHIKLAEVDIENTSLYGEKATQRLPAKKGDLPDRDQAADGNKLAWMGSGGAYSGKKGDVPSRDGNSVGNEKAKQEIGDQPTFIPTTAAQLSSETGALSR